MAYIGDSFKDFGEYASQQYGGAVFGGLDPSQASALAKKNRSALPAGLQGLDTMQAAALAKRNRSALPAGLQGLDTMQASALANRNKDSLPAGLQGLQGLPSGYEGYPSSYSDYGDLDPSQASALAHKNKNALPAGLQGLQGYEGYDALNMSQATALAHRNKGAKPAGLQGYGGLLGDLDPSQASALAHKNKNALPAGLQGYGGFMGTQDDAFDGYDGQASFNRAQVKEFVEDWNEEDDDDDDNLDGYSLAGFGEEMSSWHTHFNLAANAGSESKIIKHLTDAVQSVSDNAPADVKQNHYNLAMKMLHRRKKTDLYHLDIERVEMRTSLGWLLNPALPKKGGFKALVDKAVSSVASAVAQGGKTDLKEKRLHALGDKLKGNLRNAGMLAGLGEDGGNKTKMLLLGLGVAGAFAYWYHCKCKKGKKKRTSRKRRRK